MIDRRKHENRTNRRPGTILCIKRSLIDSYETRLPNPALDFIERAAAALLFDEDERSPSEDLKLQFETV